MSKSARCMQDAGRCRSVCQACAISMWENPSAATVAPRRPETRVFPPLSTAQLSHAANKHGQTPGLVWCITYPSWTDKGCPPTASFPGVAADSQSGGRALQPASWRCPNRPSSSVLIPSSWWRPSLRRRDTGASLAAERAVLPGDGARPRLDGREKQSAGGRKNNGRVPGRAAMCRAPACCLVSEGGDMTGPGVGGLVCRIPRVGFRGANSGERQGGWWVLGLVWLRRRFHCAQGGSAVRWPICCRFPFWILSSWLSRDRQLTSLANLDRTSPYLVPRLLLAACRPP